MKVLFFIRKSRLKKNGEAPIFLRVTINGQLDEVWIQRSVPLKLWDNVKERSKGKDRSSTELNSYIEALKVRLYQIHKELLCREALITPKNLLIKLFSKEERHLVLQTMRKCIDDWTSLIGWSSSLPLSHVITTVMNCCRRSSRISTVKRTLHSMN